MPVRPTMLTSISGDPKTGKTHLSFTWPAPIKVYSFERGAYFVRGKFPDKEIDIKGYVLPIIETPTDMAWSIPLWSEFYTEYKEDCASGKYQTLIIDTATAAWRINRLSLTEEANRNRLQQVEYEKPNLRFSTLFDYAALGGVNLVTIQYQKDKWVKGENTGVQTLDGFQHTGGQVDTILSMEVQGLGKEARMVTTIEDCRFDRTLRGQTFNDTNYDELMILLGL